MSPAPSDSASQANSLNLNDSLHTKRKDSGASYGAVLMKTVRSFRIPRNSNFVYHLNFLGHSDMASHARFCFKSKPK